MTIQEIKSRLSILLVVCHYGLMVDGEGAFPCPFHSDKNRSMKIDLRANTVCCLSGSCNVKTLGVLELIMKIEEDMDESEAAAKGKLILIGEISQSRKLRDKQRGKS